MKKTLLPLITFLLLISLTHEKLSTAPQKNMDSTSAASDSIFIATELLGRPTDKSVAINALARNDLEVYFEYGTEPSQYTNQTEVKLFPGGIPIEVTIEKLLPNMRYYYRMRYRLPGVLEFNTADAHTFHTQRPRGNAFTFAIEADPHLDEQTNPEIYKRTLQNILADNPDFLIDLGDTFMSDKLPIINETEVVNRHLLLRSYFDKTCHSVPLLLVIGNHEGELGWNLNGTSENLAIWATNARKLYFPNPSPDNFYTGNSTIEKFVGLRENYYAFEWGDALLVVLDPYWYTTIKPGNSDDNWDWTLGEQQYIWFRQMLENSHATFKFVFCHHLVGGKDTEGPGGSEYAKYYEWGGLNADSSWGFNEKRPGWGKPIHQLMAENNVTIFFHGHDHFFAKQDLDGVVYQLVPQSSHPNYKKAGQAIAYGYISGEILPNSGHLRVTVSNSMVTVDYVRAYLPADENPGEGRVNGKVDYSYTIHVQNTSAPSSDPPKNLPQGFQLYQNYPNPFNSFTAISFQLAQVSLVSIKIYDVHGREVRTLVNKMIEPGFHTAGWDGLNNFGNIVSSGLFLCRMKAEKFEKTIKLIMLN